MSSRVVCINMKAALFYGPKDLKYEEIDPYNLINGEILVKVEAALTGGTDVKTYLNGHPRIIKSIPSTFGYEFSGTIIEIAEDIQGQELANYYLFSKEGQSQKISKPESYKSFIPQIGDRVVAANTAPCYDCYFCTKQEYSLCTKLDFLNGSFSEFIKIPAQIVKHNFYKIPDSLSFENAAMVQTLAVVLHGFDRSEIKANDTIAIYGLGPIGQTFIKVLDAHRSGKLRGLLDMNGDAKDLKIIAVGRSEFKRDLAQKNGADIVIDASKKENLMLIKEYTEYGADKVIEAVGKPEVWEDCFNLVRPGGLINFFGGCPKGSKVEFETFPLHYEEVRTIGVFHHSPKYIRAALKLLVENKVDLSDLITSEEKLENLETALKKMISGEATKILIKI